MAFARENEPQEKGAPGREPGTPISHDILTTVSWETCPSCLFCPPQNSLDSRPMSVGAPDAHAYGLLLQDPSVARADGINRRNNERASRGRALNVRLWLLADIQGANLYVRF